MISIVQSAGGIVYYLWTDGEPKYLLIKRHALSGKIEWVAPKGKIQKGEKNRRCGIKRSFWRVRYPFEIFEVEAKGLNDFA